MAAVLPPHSAASYTLTGLILEHVSPETAAVVLNSLCFDFALRLRTAGTHVSMTYIGPMPVPPADAVNRLPFVGTRLAWQAGIDHITKDESLWPLLWDANHAVAQAYGLTPEDLEHILGTFPVLARKRQEFFDYLKERIEEWRRGASRMEISPATHVVPAPDVQHAMAGPAAQSRSSRASKPSRQKASSQFQQAAVLAWVVQQMYNPSHPVSRFRAGKMVYLIERAVQLGLFKNYLKQAAGPYDPNLRYRGPEDIAVRQQGWLTAVDENHFAPGPKKDEALRYARRYLDLAQATTVIEQFRTYQDSTLSRWTTVDMAARELQNRGEPVTPDRVWAYLEEIPEWRHKLEREEFSMELIAYTLTGLRKLGFLVDA